MKRRLIIIGSTLLIAIIVLVSISFLIANEFTKKDDFVPINATEVMNTKNLQVLFINHFLCGKDQYTYIETPFKTLSELTTKYSDWYLTSNQDNLVIMEKDTEDLAPDCKENAYFGITKDGLLTLFAGPPTEENIIQTFFYLDLKDIESSNRESPIAQLQNGIRIHDKEEYLSVISSYIEFSTTQ